MPVKKIEGKETAYKRLCYEQAATMMYVSDLFQLESLHRTDFLLK
jgi:hypothetical protein